MENNNEKKWGSEVCQKQINDLDDLWDIWEEHGIPQEMSLAAIALYAANQAAGMSENDSKEFIDMIKAQTLRFRKAKAQD